MTDLAADLFAMTGLKVSMALVILCATLGPALLILAVVLAMSRRIDRLEEWLMDLRRLHVAFQDTQTQHASVVSRLESIAGTLPDLDGVKEYLRGANSTQSELISAVSKVSVDLAAMRDKVEARLAALQSNQSKMYKVLKAWDSRLNDLEQTVAAVPGIQAEQVGIKNELAEWYSRLDVAAEKFAECLQSEDQPSDRMLTSDAPTIP